MPFAAVRPNSKKRRKAVSAEGGQHPGPTETGNRVTRRRVDSPKVELRQEPLEDEQHQLQITADHKEPREGQERH